MDQQNPNNTPDGSGSGDVPLKRKRGRPRKYPKAGDSEESSYALSGQIISPNPGSGGQTSLPPVYEGFGNQRLQTNQENSANDAMVGQAVSGLIEAVFDAGYLLNVRVGDSDTTLRGLVFMPGRYVPISPENDVAPGVPMIRRNEVPFPSGTASEVQNPLLKERNQQHVNDHGNESPTMIGSPIVPRPRGAVSPIKIVASSGKNSPSSAGQTTPQLPSPIVPPGPRGAVSPFKMVASSGKNSPSSAGQTTPQLPSPIVPQGPRGTVSPIKMVASPGKNSPSSEAQTTPQLPSSLLPQGPRGAVSPIKMVASPGNISPSSEGQTTPQLPSGNMVPVFLQPDKFSNEVPISNQPSQVMANISVGSGEIVTEDIPVGGNQAITSHTQPSSSVLNGDGASPVSPPCLPFEPMDTEDVNRVQPPSDPMDDETDNSNSGGQIPLKDPSIGKEDKTNDMDQPVPMNTLQEVQSNPHESPAPPTFSDSPMTEKMTEQLQDDNIENQTSKTEEQGSGNKSDDEKNLGTELEED